ncbi:cytochrome P450 [Laetiporus sulphureus 93-53]|uniref:Cytochrome P450 n=1 Tax=Laetiporus sulphureus 93-53 TaxID=1314785 RepID=A0A165FF74_9APHY|nr:cytochrome P450 [Laetiporus sulphureus 93-53]KZT08878.1 cytochrome P450 [Laetiporus sulphureus 93-53]
MHTIPTVGPSFPLLSYIGAYRFLRDAQGMMEEGYSKYKVFKVAQWDQWLVIVSGATMNRELSRLPDNVMSAHEAGVDLIQARYTIGKEIFERAIEIMAIRGPLTHKVGAMIPEMMDEAIASFGELIPVKDNEWLEVTASPTITRIIARASNRLFVGLPVCREPEYLDTLAGFSVGVVTGKFVMDLFPKFLKPYVGSVLPWTPRAKRRIAKYLTGIIEERQEGLRQYGPDWADKPNDTLMFLIEEANKIGHSVDLVIQGVLSMNFAALHTTSMSVTHALYYLASNPEIMQPLREEIEPIVKAEGWNRQALHKMWKLDSFIKESQRMDNPVALSIFRKTVQDVTFSDGTHVPKGVLVFATASATHRDKEVYENAGAFRPFRFADMRASGEGENVKHQLVAISPEYIAFGHGKHACPGRFFASAVMKITLAWIMLNYDVKMAGDAGRPRNFAIGSANMPARNAKVLFRKRQYDQV